MTKAQKQLHSRITRKMVNSVFYQVTAKHWDCNFYQAIELTALAVNKSNLVELQVNKEIIRILTPYKSPL